MLYIIVVISVNPERSAVLCAGVDCLPAPKLTTVVFAFILTTECSYSRCVGTVGSLLAPKSSESLDTWSVSYADSNHPERSRVGVPVHRPTLFSVSAFLLVTLGDRFFARDLRQEIHVGRRIQQEFPTPLDLLLIHTDKNSWRMRVHNLYAKQIDLELSGELSFPFTQYRVYMELALAAGTYISGKTVRSIMGTALPRLTSNRANRPFWQID